jgi:nucleotide-binding universal stress UspA family protein
LTIKDIVFHLDTEGAGAGVSDFALSLAASAGAYLTAAAVAIFYAPLAMNGGSFGAGLDFNAVDAFAELTEHSRKAAKEAYERLAKTAPSEVHTEFVMIEALPQLAGDEFGRLARCFDISIVGQATPQGADYERHMITGALFNSGRPVFVVPSRHEGPANLEKAIVCWDGGAQAARAVAESLPLLAGTQRVEVVCVGSEKHPPGRPTGAEIVRRLGRHGIASTLRELPAGADVGSTILAYAAESAADYIVMGAYGHWRLREFVFGGTTRTLLASTTVPLFMTH